MKIRDEEEGEGGGYVSPPLQRAARLLRYIGDGGTVSNMREAAARLEISRTTLLRLLHTLELERFIERVDSTGEYQIGIGLISIVGNNAFGQDLVHVALPTVAWLAEDTGLSAHLGVLDGTDAVYLARRVPNVPLASNIKVGSRISAHATTLGRAILAFMEPKMVRALFTDRLLNQHTDRTPGSLTALEARLASELADGYSSSDGMYSEGVSSIAAPIFGHDGDVIASVNVTGPTELFVISPDRRGQIAAAVLSAARTISIKLGYRGSPAQASGGSAVA